MIKILISVIALSLLQLSVAGNEQAGELEVHNTFKPESCSRKAKVTDVVTLHYKGSLQNGEVFESR